MNLNVVLSENVFYVCLHVFRVLWIYATMKTRLGVRAGKAWPPKGVLILFSFVAFLFY